MPSPFTLQLIERHYPVPDVLHLVLAPLDGRELKFKPGQFVQLFFTDAQGQPQRRSFSLANAPTAAGTPGRWELLVSLLPGGAASRYLAALPLAATIEGAGPFGRFHLMPNDAPERYLLIATGTGVAPFRGMLAQLRERLAAGARVELLCGARTRGELLHADEFLALARASPGFAYQGCLTRETPAPEQHWLRPGRVQSALRELQPAAGDLALVCGNPAMVDECTQLLRDAGLPLRAIRRERYIASG